MQGGLYDDGNDQRYRREDRCSCVDHFRAVAREVLLSFFRSQDSFYMSLTFQTDGRRD